MQHIPRNRESFIDQLNPFVNRIFQHAVMQGDLAIVTLMLNHGIVVKRNERNPHGLTAIQQSVLDGNSRLAMKLLESGADMEAKTSNGWTCLHIASATGDMHIAKLLLAHCADAVSLTNTDELPIDLAMNTDMKILLANEMSRCGYIELSQWYMGKITQQGSGMFYLMSADSLLEIACERPESFTNAGYDFYHQNFIHSYSSMINLSRNTASEMNLASHKRKLSGWSGSQQETGYNVPVPTNNDTYSLTLPSNSKIDKKFSQNETSTGFLHSIKKSTSSASVIYKPDIVEPSFNGEPNSTVVSYSKCKPKEDSVVERKEEVDACHKSIETLEASWDKWKDQRDITAQNSTNTESVQTAGYNTITRRKHSIRRRPSNASLFDRDADVNNRLEVTIDYYQDSFDCDQDEEEDDDYIYFNDNRRHRFPSGTSSSSFEVKDTNACHKDKSSFPYQDNGVVENREESYENCQNYAVEVIPGNRELLTEFADYHGNDCQFADKNSGNSEFEIDTDKMDQYVINSDGSVDEIDGSEDNTDLEDREVFSDRNMYFNPMYNYKDIPSSVLRIDARKEDSTSTCDAESEEDIQLEWNDNSSYEHAEENLYHSNAEQKPYEIYTEETELICNETQHYERKRKKKGLLSELVSKFKKGTSKMQRTSSDTNLRDNKENAVIRRDTRKVKTLRRRRHVRRSNSFSSYFNGESEGSPTKMKMREPHIHSKKDFQKKSDDKEKYNERQVIEPPYSPHRMKRSPFSPHENEHFSNVGQFSSLPRKNSKGKEPFRGSKNRNNSVMPDADNFMREDSRHVEKLLLQKGMDVGIDNAGSRIPKRSINTYNKGIEELVESNGQNGGCVSMKLLCK